MTEMTKPVLPEKVKLWQETLGWQPDSGHLLEFQALYELIVEGNQQLNLTRITQPDEFWEKHLWDSLRGVAPFLTGEVLGTGEFPPKVIDIGTGAGFPGLPVAIARPDWNVTLLDSTRKKIAFLNRLIDTSGLENAHTLTGRAEEIAQQRQHREAYDLALARALGPAFVCAEYVLPFLKIGAIAVLYRGHWTDEDTEALSVAVKPLGGIIDFIERFTTPLTHSVRHCVYLRKIAREPSQFPRPVGIRTQNPLSSSSESEV